MKFWWAFGHSAILKFDSIGFVCPGLIIRVDCNAALVTCETKEYRNTLEYNYGYGRLESKLIRVILGQFNPL